MSNRDKHDRLQQTIEVKNGREFQNIDTVDDFTQRDSQT